MKYCFLIPALFLALATSTVAQNPLKWSFSYQDAGNGQYDLICTGTLDEGYTTYSQFLESEDGPVATSLTFKDGDHFTKVGKAAEGGEKYTTYDKVFGMNLTKFKHKAVFTQRVKVTDFSKPIAGYITAMVCNEDSCLPPRDVDFSFKITPATPTPASAPSQGNAPSSDPKQDPGRVGVTTPNNNTGTIALPSPTDEESKALQSVIPPIDSNAAIANDDPNFKGYFDSKRAIDLNPAKFTGQCGAPAQESNSLWIIFLLGMLAGFAAVLTPCIFPMIPVTVGFFVKRTKDRATGIRNALGYGLSILLIYVGIGIGITMLFGPTALNEMSTNMWFNLLFFVVFLVFALSFFGLFEISLPSSWVNASDRMADKGGALGIFFMAFTLALVSFSCTGPLVGSLLVEAASTNAGATIAGIPAGPLAGLTGFGLALALPFALFALFPGWLQAMPKSGGWMDNVKITLGFVELALAFKFLSTADMVQHWGVLKFELFLGIWLLCALLLGLYQLGLTGWKGAKGRPGVVRLAVAALALGFSAYLGYGLLNYQSLSALSGIAPPVHYNFFRPMDCPHGLDCYKDFDEALAMAKLENKPLFVDFTGYGCVNCRKMEETVWNKPEIIRHLRDNYIVVSLYVDDRARLFPDDKFSYLEDRNNGNKLRTVGDKWSSFQINNFKRNSQPWYVLMSNDGKSVLTEPRGYTPNVKDYKSFLDCGYDAFLTLQKRDGQRDLMGAKE
jgi:thiol:disulfide interchange protein